MCSGIGHIFIYKVVKDFGPLVLAIVTTSRKFMTVVFSSFIFGHVFNLKQKASIGIVFLGVFSDVYAHNFAENNIERRNIDDDKRD